MNGITFIKDNPSMQEKEELQVRLSVTYQPTKDSKPETLTSTGQFFLGIMADDDTIKRYCMGLSSDRHLAETFVQLAWLLAETKPQVFSIVAEALQGINQTLKS